MKQIQNKWSDLEAKIINDNYGKLSYEAISKLLPNRTVFQIRNKANYMGLCSKNNLRKYSINKHFFKLPTKKNCYWAGFIAADGCVMDRGMLSIGLSVNDIDLLREFVKDIKYTNPVKIYKKTCRVSINSKEICKDLKTNFNIIPRKSKILQPPNIKDEKLIQYFIKGLIDGDGSVDGNRITIYGTKAILDWVKYYFDKWTKRTNYRLSNVNRIQANLFSYKIGSARRDFIYNRFIRLNCYNLKRKWGIHVTNQ